MVGVAFIWVEIGGVVPDSTVVQPSSLGTSTRRPFPREGPLFLRGSREREVRNHKNSPPRRLFWHVSDRNGVGLIRDSKDGEIVILRYII